MNLFQLYLQFDERKWKRIVRKWFKQHQKRMSRIDLSRVSSIQSRNIQANHMFRIQYTGIAYWSKIKTIRQHIRCRWNNRLSWSKDSLTLLTNHWTRAKSLLSLIESRCIHKAETMPHLLKLVKLAVAKSSPFKNLCQLIHQACLMRSSKCLKIKPHHSMSPGSILSRLMSLENCSYQRMSSKLS